MTGRSYDAAPMQAQAPTPPADAMGEGSAPWRWTRPAVATLMALTGVNLFNYVDRFVLSALYTQLELPVAEGGLALDKVQQGQLYSAFIIVYALSSPVFGLLGDRYRRTWIIAGAVALWSLATVAGGFAGGMLALLIARAFTGVGEAAYASIAPSVISDRVPPVARGRALAIFNTAIPVGAALGFILGGVVATAYGWREAFFVAGAPGLLLAVWVFFLHEPTRGAMDAGRPATKPRIGQVARRLLRRAFVLPVAGYTLQTAGFGALAIWAPSYLQQAKGMDPAAATTIFGIVVVVTGIGGTVVGGVLGDRWRRRNRRALMWVCALTSLAAAPCVAAIVFTRDPVLVWACIAAGNFLLVMSIGPVNAQIVNALNPNERATGIAVSTTVIHVLGDVPSVPFIGAMVDRLAATVGVAAAWEQAFLFIPAAILVGGMVWVAAALWGVEE